MAYKAEQAITALNNYLDITENDKTYIKDTKNRGFTMKIANDEEIAVFVYPLVHKADNSKNYFDTRDSGASERIIACKYADKHDIKYYCLGVNDSVEKYNDYVFSLECDDRLIEKISGTVNGVRNGKGNQIIIPNDFIPSKSYERIRNKLGVYISVIHKDYLRTYLENYDNRPYVVLPDLEDNNDKKDLGYQVQNVEIYGIHMMKKNDALSYDNPHICIGWHDMGDMSAVISRDDLEELYCKVYSNENSHSRGQEIGNIWRFISEANIGDIVVYSKEKECHIGRIESDYYYEEVLNDKQDKDYVNNRKVTWLKKHIQFDTLPEDFINSLNTQMSFWSLNKHKDKIIDILSSKSTAPEIGFAHNRILFGAPGTGKSHQLKKDMEIPFADEECFERVTFHPAYSYAHFFGCYKPVSEGNDIRYEFVPGPFARIWAKAMNNPGENYLLLIEEINRAEVAAVFGDMFQLLDRTNGESTYSVAMSEDFKKYLAKEYPGIVSDKMKLPRNMYIWATMNSADQGVYPMDTAFKRRWNFEYTSLDAAKDALYDKKFILNCPKANENDRVQSFTWNELRESLNTWLSDKNVNEDKLMGPFFLSADIVGKAEIEARIKAAVDTVDAADTDAVKKAVETVLKDISSRFSAAFKNKVLMYLFDDAAKPKRPLLFSNAGQQNRYSKICEEFDAKGLKIFSPEISEHGKILYDREAARASEEEIDAILSQYGPGYVPEQSVVADPNQDTDVGNEA